jgi:hypothetical protein
MSHRTFVRGDDYDIVVRINTGTGVRKDLTNINNIHYTICHSAKTPLEEVPYHCEYMDGISIPDHSEGIVLIRLPAEVTQNLHHSQAYHTCWIIDESGRKTTLFGEWRDVIDEKFKEVL